MKQTNIKPKQRNNKTIDQHKTSYTKTNNTNYSKSPMIKKTNKDFIITTAIDKHAKQSQVNDNRIQHNDITQKESTITEHNIIIDYQINNIIPKRLKLKPQLLVKRSPLPVNTNATNNKPSNYRQGFPDSLFNISSCILPDEESLLPEAKRQPIEEENKGDKEIILQIADRREATATGLMTSKSPYIAGLKSDKNYSDNINEANRDMFEYENEKIIKLTPSEIEEYGDRQLDNYQKGRILGKGGCGIVWSCINNSNGREYALKQVSKRPKKLDGVSIPTLNAQMARKEIEILIFISKKLESTHQENNMITLFAHFEDSNDVWLVFEKGGKSLSSLSLRIKGEFCGTERVYTMKQGKFLHKLINDISQLKSFIRSMLSFIHFLSMNSIVHGDIKPDNILINFNSDDYSIKDVKVIDFGSAYFLTNPSNFSSNTPEYMSPEITKLLESNKSMKEVLVFLMTLRECPWCVDMWSLGVSLLETVIACPLWMTYKAKVSIRGKAIIKTGLFGVKGRDGNKIYNKQIEVAKNLNSILKQSLINDLNDKQLFCDLLSKMLEIDHTQRISPIEALNHPFLLIGEAKFSNKTCI